MQSGPRGRVCWEQTTCTRGVRSWWWRAVRLICAGLLAACISQRIGNGSQAMEKGKTGDGEMGRWERRMLLVKETVKQLRGRCSESKYRLVIRSQWGAIMQKSHSLLRFCSRCRWQDETAMSNCWCWPTCCFFFPHAFWGITGTLIPPDPSTLRHGRVNPEWGSKTSRRWGIGAE